MLFLSARAELLPFPSNSAANKNAALSIPLCRHSASQAEFAVCQPCRPLIVSALLFGVEAAFFEPRAIFSVCAALSAFCLLTIILGFKNANHTY